mmetsp:Transcript_28217/g.67007  ORF Transcript_28217/g.67007 Transcript_28217/m.67007 type:complete len:262 (+) Transcript_28217:656-1441(+)
MRLGPSPSPRAARWCRQRAGRPPREPGASPRGSRSRRPSQTRTSRPTAAAPCWSRSPLAGRSPRRPSRPPPTARSPCRRRRRVLPAAVACLGSRRPRGAHHTAPNGGRPDPRPAASRDRGCCRAWRVLAAAAAAAVQQTRRRCLPRPLLPQASAPCPGWRTRSATSNGHRGNGIPAWRRTLLCLATRTARSRARLRAKQCLRGSRPLCKQRPLAGGTPSARSPLRPTQASVAIGLTGTRLRRAQPPRAPCRPSSRPLSFRG